jgi:hypothetical protein
MISVGSMGGMFEISRLYGENRHPEHVERNMVCLLYR